MRLFNYEIEVSLRSLQPWTHLKLHKHRDGRFGPVYYRHLVFGKLSIIFGQPHLLPVTVCAECNGDISGISAGDEGWNVCDGCGTIEGKTLTITTEQWEALQ